MGAPPDEPFEPAFVAACGGRQWDPHSEAVDDFLANAVISDTPPRPQKGRDPTPGEVWQGSGLRADLSAGRRAVRFSRPVVPGDWSETTQETPEPAFWGRARWAPVWSDRGLIIRHHTPAGEVDYVDGVLFWAPSSEAQTKEEASEPDHADDGTLKERVWPVAEQILLSPDAPPRGHGRLAELSRRVADKLGEKEGTVRQYIGRDFAEWRRRNPDR